MGRAGGIVRGVAEAFDLTREPRPVIDRYDTAAPVHPDSIDKKWNNHKWYTMPVRWGSFS